MSWFSIINTVLYGITQLSYCWKYTVRPFLCFRRPTRLMRCGAWRRVASRGFNLFVCFCLQNCRTFQERRVAAFRVLPKQTIGRFSICCGVTSLVGFIIPDVASRIWADVACIRSVFCVSAGIKVWRFWFSYQRELACNYSIHLWREIKVELFIAMICKV